MSTSIEDFVSWAVSAAGIEQVENVEIIHTDSEGIVGIRAARRIEGLRLMR